MIWVPFQKERDPKYDSTDVWGQDVEVFPQGYGVPLVGGRKKIVYTSHATPQNITVTESSPQTERREKVKLMDELWWVFQFVDMGVEQMIDYVDTQLEKAGLATPESSGYVAVQVFLIIGPVLVCIYAVAVNVLTANHRRDVSDSKLI